MTPLAGKPVLTAAQMRAAETAAIARGATVERLMARAGGDVAAVARRLAAGAPVLLLCGPGNNGGDGYVAATMLAAAGHPVRVAAWGDPATGAARAARLGWGGEVEAIADAAPAPVVVDALFGTGVSRALDPTLADALVRLVGAAHLSIAVDLPSGVATDGGAVFGTVPRFHLTLALGAAKPAHLLEPAAGRCGTVRVLDIGVETASNVAVIARPGLGAPQADDHKYSRGMVAVVGGAMPGAGRLAANAALRAGAGYVLLLDGSGGADAVVCRPFGDASLEDRRIGAVVIGPGLGRDAAARRKLDRALASGRRLIIDGDALHLLDLAALRGVDAILTPRAGEFAALFGAGAGSKLDRARDAAARSGATIVFKGADTVIAAPDGRARLGEAASSWLSSAGTGDVLAGAIAAMAAAGLDPLEAASAGVWLHGDAARRLGPAFIADDLAHALSAARAGL